MREKRAEKNKNIGCLLFVFAALLLPLLLATIPAAVLAADTGAWEDLNPANPPPPRYDHTGALLNGNFYIFGGMVPGSAEAPNNGLWGYNGEPNTWHKVDGANPPPVRSRSSMNALNGKLYVVAGKGTDPNNYLRDTRKYDPATKTWTNMNPSGVVPNNVARHSTVVWDGKIWLFGGRMRYDSSGTQGDYLSNYMYYYEPGTNSWTYVSMMNTPSPRQGQSMVVYNNKFYVYGGKDQNNIILNQFVEYDPATGTWTQLPEPPVSARYAHFATICNGKMIIGGGEGASGGKDDCWEYDFTTGTWTEIESLPQEISGTTAVVIGDKIYIFGGRSGGWPIDKTYRYAKVVKKCYVETVVVPACAAEEGCSAEPEQEECKCGEGQVTVTAAVSAEAVKKGWEFSHWTGAIPAGEKVAQAPCPVEGTHTATAHFARVVPLGVSSSETMFKCIDALPGENIAIMGPIWFCAQPNHEKNCDWKVGELKFNFLEKGNPELTGEKIIKQVVLRKGEQEISKPYSKKLEFPVSVSVQKGECAPESPYYLILEFKPKAEFPDVQCPCECREFEVELTVVAEPAEDCCYTGVVICSPQSKLSIGCVWNEDTKECFEHIQDAIDDSDTKDGHTILVCPGEYEENVKVTKELTVKLDITQGHF